jgi:hypothetical protein
LMDVIFLMLVFLNHSKFIWFSYFW